MTKAAPTDIQPMFAPDARGIERVVIDQPNVVDPMLDSNPGPSVNLYDRATSLHATLKDLGEANKLAGLRTVNETAYGRRALEQRYDHVDRVVGNATDKQARHELAAKQHFARAFGVSALAGFIGDQAAKSEARKEYGEFVSRFTRNDESSSDIAKSGGTKKTAQQKRDQLKRKLAKHI